MNTDSPLDDLVEEMLVQIPVLVTKEEIADYKAKAKLYCHKQVIEAFEFALMRSKQQDEPDLEEVIKEELAKLRKTL